MKPAKLIPATAAVAIASTLAGCGGDRAAGVSPPGPGSVGVGQGGAQDFGLFRQILEDGEIPGPETLDDVGFFAEHKLDYPPPSCGEDLCMHGLLGAMDNMISGGNCTLIQIGLNSPIDPAELERPPMHLVIAVDVSGSMGGQPIEYLRTGLLEMVDELEPDDTVSLVEYSDRARVVLEAVSAGEPSTLRTAFEGLEAGGSTNLYEGLFTAFQLAADHRDPAGQNRVIFLSDGRATAGLESPAKLRSLTRAYGEEGIALTSIGVGEDFDVEVMRSLSEVGAGNFYFLEDPQAVTEVFAEEVNTFLYPVALDARIDVSVGSGYTLRAAYGTSGWKSYESGGYVEIPALYLAGRTSAEEPIEGGRRGGGGAILLELVPRSNNSGEEPRDAGYLALEWRHPMSGEPVTQNIEIAAPHAPGQAPDSGYFSHGTVEKGFVMLNIYAAFDVAARLAADSDPRTAQATLEALRPGVEAWLEENPDPDIEQDLYYVDLFIENLDRAIEDTVVYEPAPPPDPWPAD